MNLSVGNYGNNFLQNRTFITISKFENKLLDIECSLRDCVIPIMFLILLIFDFRMTGKLQN